MHLSECLAIRKCEHQILRMKVIPWTRETYSDVMEISYYSIGTNMIVDHVLIQCILGYSDLNYLGT